MSEEKNSFPLERCHSDIYFLVLPQACPALPEAQSQSDRARVPEAAEEEKMCQAGLDRTMILRDKLTLDSFPSPATLCPTLRTQKVDVVPATGHCTLCVAIFTRKVLVIFPLIVLRAFFHLLKAVYLA